MEKTDTKITCFTDGDWFIDIVEDEEIHEAWLQHKDYGIAALMFGMMKKDKSFEEFCETVKMDLENQKDFYRDEYMDMDDE